MPAKNHSSLGQTTLPSENLSPTSPKAAPEYVPPFQLLSQLLSISADDMKSQVVVRVPTAFLRFLMQMALERGPFDERWYLETNPDVQRALREEGVLSAFEHYASAGYYEGRSPGPQQVDVNWYQEYYQDIRQAVIQGEILDCEEHFNQSGYFEGRVASADEVVTAQKWRTALEGGTTAT